VAPAWPERRQLLLDVSKAQSPAQTSTWLGRLWLWFSCLAEVGGWWGCGGWHNCGSSGKLVLVVVVLNGKSRGDAERHQSWEESLVEQPPRMSC